MEKERRFLCFGRKRKIDKNKKKIFIWDLDETLIIFQSLLIGKFAKKYKKNNDVCRNVALHIESLIMKISDDHFFFYDFEDDNPVNLIDLPTETTAAVFDIRERKEKIDKISDLYENSTLADLMSTTEKVYWMATHDNLMDITNPWHEISAECLRIVKERNCENVIVTTTHMIPAITKLMLYDLSKFIDISNVYSATQLGKEECFRRIKSKYGEVDYVAIGDGYEEKRAARMTRMPFRHVHSLSDLRKIYADLVNDKL